MEISEKNKQRIRENINSLSFKNYNGKLRIIYGNQPPFETCAYFETDIVLKESNIWDRDNSYYLDLNKPDKVYSFCKEVGINLDDMNSILKYFINYYNEYFNKCEEEQKEHNFTKSYIEQLSRIM